MVRRSFVVAFVVAVVGITGCSDDGKSGPSPGGINGPARVEPNPGANNPVDAPDE